MSTISKYPRGSEWRKWDLHIHSPESIIQDYGKDNWDKFIKTLESLPKEVKVIGLTDYYFLDGYEKLINYKLNKGRLQNIDKIFPILEFRIDTFASASENKFQKINLHILFGINEDDIKQEIEKVKKEFIEQIHITKLEKHKTKILSRENFIKCSSNGNIQSGFDDLIPNTDEVFGLLSSEPWKDNTLSFLGYKEWNNLDKGKQLKIFKDDLCNKVNIFLSATKLDTIEKKNEILKDYGNKVLLLSNDIHSFKAFEEYECHTWIKADPTFEGLKQILYEPERVYIGGEPPKRKYVEQNKEYFINSLKIFAESNNGEWFDNLNEEIVFNPGLVSIIGNKGHGKSAIADILGMLSNVKLNRENFSFLHADRFLHPSLVAKNKYSGKIIFNDKYLNEKSFIKPDFEENKPVKAIYLSQHFVNNICENLESSSLQNQINEVILSHLPEQKKAPFNLLEKLIESETRTIKQKLLNESKKLSKINKDIVELELKKSPKEVEKLESTIKEKSRLIDELKKDVRTKVKKPKGISGSDVTKSIDRKIEKLEKDSAFIQKELNEASKDRRILNEIKGDFETLAQEIIEILEKWEKEETVTKNKIDLRKIFGYNFDYSKVTLVINKLDDNIQKLDEKKKKATDEIKKLNNQRAEITKKLTRQGQEYKLYLEKRKSWLDKIKNIEGDVDEIDSLKYYEEQYRYIKNQLSLDLEQKRSERKERVKKIIDLLFETKKIYSNIYKDSQLYAKERAEEFGIKDDFIEFDSRINLKTSFYDDFYNNINRNHVGSFHDDSNKVMLKELSENIYLQTEDGLLQFVELLEDVVKKDYRKKEKDRNEQDYQAVIKQVKTKNLADYYDFIYSLEYIDTLFEITYGGKKIAELSPGERGTLLLIFYLLIDKDKKPIIIDQPEENLDNETIFRKLVPFIKKVKEQRQIIIVTHNPNLAIVCDSEQIIHAHIDKKNNNLVSYNSGSIEYYKIREKAMDILEGTEKAFTNRKNKYEIK